MSPSPPSTPSTPIIRIIPPESCDPPHILIVIIIPPGDKENPSQRFSPQKSSQFETAPFSHTVCSGFSRRELLSSFNFQSISFSSKEFTAFFSKFGLKRTSGSCFMGYCRENAGKVQFVLQIREKRASVPIKRTHLPIEF